MFFLSRGCHVSSTWDNINPFSPGFMKASEVADTVDKYQQILNSSRSEKTKCEARAKIAEAYRRLPYEQGLATMYAEEANSYFCREVRK
jgi:hypothetical protein